MPRHDQPSLLRLLQAPLAWLLIVMAVALHVAAVSQRGGLPLARNRDGAGALPPEPSDPLNDGVFPISGLFSPEKPGFSTRRSPQMAAGLRSKPARLGKTPLPLTTGSYRPAFQAAATQRIGNYRGSWVPIAGSLIPRHENPF